MVVNININRKHLIFLIIVLAVATVINYTIAQGGTQSHPYSEITLPAGGAVWPDLNADMVDGYNATDFASAGPFDIQLKGLATDCNEKCSSLGKQCAFATIDGGGYVAELASCSTTGTRQCACWP
jgi:hypothetical protein